MARSLRGWLPSGVSQQAWRCQACAHAPGFARWISVLLVGSRSEVLAAQGDLAPALLDGLADASDQVVLQALDVQASLSREDPHFRVFMVRSQSCHGRWHPRLSPLDPTGTASAPLLQHADAAGVAW
jgi:hypothetical protein